MNFRAPLLPFALLWLAVPCVAADEPPRTIWGGVFSAAQAARGQKAYVTECARCHGDKLEGGKEDSPPLVAEPFLKEWNGKTVGRLVDVTRRTMPPETAGTMSRPLTLDLVAYLLSANGFPAGSKDLPTDSAALREITIEPKK
jgi:mono/diheme cytochrome c family protein